MKAKGLKIIGAVAAFVLVAFSTQDVAAQSVAKRQVRQQARISEGVKSGELTRREARNLRQDQRDVKQMKKLAKADGKVTCGERAVIRSEQRQANREIYRKKHNGRDRN
ncbi:hypothetical protein V6R21_30345 [Limibacter armeniacum]|uniref:hypothetical protein n=1 Tax=Limibacter armeniacum TaxID=466084 RepID=UPI002FE510DD